MAKFSKITKPSESEVIDLLKDFFESLAIVRGPQELSKVLSDLLTRQELIMIAKRLKIAKLLLEGNTFHQTLKKTRTSTATIARVSVWLNSSGEGYRLVHQRRSTREKQEPAVIWRTLKKRYPVYFWPQLLTGKIAEQISERERQQLRKILKLLEDKSHIMRAV
jgi:TrpR-related protein YerC/YecD